MIAVGASICLFNAIRLVKELLQMYRMTKRLRLNRYVRRLVREGVVYFVVYVHIFFREFPSNRKLLWIASWYLQSLPCCIISRD